MAVQIDQGLQAGTFDSFDTLLYQGREAMTAGRDRQIISNKRRYKLKKLFLLVVMAMVAMLSVTGCSSAANVASQNLSTAADNFQVERRIVFYNGITGAYILEIEGLCSLGNDDPAGELSVTCKVSPTEYKKHFLGLSDNVTYFAEQIDPATVDAFHYRVIFRPDTILPDINVSTSSNP